MKISNGYYAWATPKPSPKLIAALAAYFLARDELQEIRDTPAEFTTGEWERAHNRMNDVMADLVVIFDTVVEELVPDGLPGRERITGEVLTEGE